MRLIFLLIILAGCSSPEINIKENEDTKADSVLIESEKSFINADSISKRTDSAINKKVEHTVKQITTLKQEVKLLKEENNALKIDAADDAGKPFRLLPVSNSKNDR